MVKSIVTVTLDTDLIEIARAEKLNISGVLNDMLKGYLANKTYKPPKEEEKLDEELIKLEGKLSKLRLAKEKFEIVRRKQEEEFAKLPRAVRVLKEKGVI